MQTIFQIHDGNVQLFSGFSLEVNLVILIALVALATAFDVREHRIPNWLIATGILIAIPYHALAPSGQGAIFSLLGLLAGVSTLLPLYALRTMGAGDVKLMGMVGAYLGTAATINAALTTLIAGGVLAIVASVYKRRLPQLVSNLHIMLIQRHIRQMVGPAANSLPPPPSVGKLPYAVAIAAGTGIQIFMLNA